jgi:hypothetical protein
MRAIYARLGGETTRQRCCFRLVAIVSADAYETPTDTRALALGRRRARGALLSAQSNTAGKVSSMC